MIITAKHKHKQFVCLQQIRLNAVAEHPKQIRVIVHETHLLSFCLDRAAVGRLDEDITEMGFILVSEARRKFKEGCGLASWKIFGFVDNIDESITRKIAKIFHF